MTTDPKSSTSAVSKAALRERALDHDYIEGVVTRAGDGFVEWQEDGGIGTSGCGMAVPAKVGDRIRVYGRVGQRIRGIDLNGQPATYQSKAEIEAENRRSLIAEARRKAREYEKEGPKLRAQVDALPEPFQRRIARFRAGRPDWDVEYLGYELGCCVDAVKLATALKTPKAVERFSKLGWKAQIAKVPGLSDQGAAGGL